VLPLTFYEGKPLCFSSQNMNSKMTAWNTWQIQGNYHGCILLSLSLALWFVQPQPTMSLWCLRESMLLSTHVCLFSRSHHNGGIIFMIYSCYTMVTSCVLHLILYELPHCDSHHINEDLNWHDRIYLHGDPSLPCIGSVDELLIWGSIGCALAVKFCREAWAYVFQRNQKAFWEIPPKDNFIKIINIF